MKDSKLTATETDRRAFLTTAGKFAVVTPPAMSLLLSTTMTSPAIAQSGASAGPPRGNNGNGNGNDVPKGNNGVGNGEDPQPPGNPPINDGPGTGPGNPGNRGGPNGG